MLYQSETLYVRWLEEGIAELVFASPGSVNTLGCQPWQCVDRA